MEIDVCAGYRVPEDIDAMIAMMREQFGRIPEPQRLVICADWRACRILTPPVAERAVQMLIRSNPRVERSAILHNAHQATSLLQVFRLAREAQQQAERRIYTDALEMEEWLGEVLTPEERARVHSMLQRPSPP